MLNVNTLLLTSNVGSMFEEGHTMIQSWLDSITSVVQKYNPKILCIHCQEVGGKDFDVSIDSVNEFVIKFLDLEVLKDFDRGRIHLDNDHNNIELFTALGTLYMFHKSVPPIHCWNFEEKCYKPVTDRKVFFQNFKDCRCFNRIKYPLELFPDKRFSRKGYLHSRYLIGTKVLDLVNIHLFHDANNFVAKEKVPSFYSEKRRKALEYVLKKLKEDNTEMNIHPCYIYGDFNFRLSTKQVIEYLCGGTKAKEVFSPEGTLMEQNFERVSDNQVLLKMKVKSFQYYNPCQFTFEAGREFRKFDSESNSFAGELHELPVRFPPSYPFSEDLDKGNQFLGTRCPSWCDRILAFPSGMKAIKESPIEPVYNSMSPDICIGDHKPVFLSFTLRIDEEVPLNGNVNDVLTELDDTYKECIKGINNAMNEESTSLQE